MDILSSLHVGTCFDVCFFVLLNSANLHLPFFTIDLMLLKEECTVPNETEEKEQYETHHDFITGEEAFVGHRLKRTFSLKTAHTTGTKSYFTPFHCEKSFNEHGNMRIHTGDKPFICQQCGKSFTYELTLKCT